MPPEKDLFDVDSWLGTMRQRFNIPQEEIVRAATEIKRGFKRQDEFSRGEDRIRQRETELERIEREQHEWYAANRPLLEKAAHLQQNYGSLDDVEQKLIQTPTEAAMTDEEKQALIAQATVPLQNQLGQVLELNRFLIKKTQTHQSEFKEMLDVDALERFAVEQVAAGRRFQNYDAVYEEYVRDKRREKEEQDKEEWKKQTRAELERDLASRNTGPFSAPPGAPRSPLYETREAADPAASTAADARNSFIRTFMESE